MKEHPARYLCVYPAVYVYGIRIKKHLNSDFSYILVKMHKKQRVNRRKFSGAVVQNNVYEKKRKKCL